MNQIKKRSYNIFEKYDQSLYEIYFLHYLKRLFFQFIAFHFLTFFLPFQSPSRRADFGQFSILSFTYSFHVFLFFLCYLSQPLFDNSCIRFEVHREQTIILTIYVLLCWQELLSFSVSLSEFLSFPIPYFVFSTARLLLHLLGIFPFSDLCYPLTPPYQFLLLLLFLMSPLYLFIQSTCFLPLGIFRAPHILTSTTIQRF